MIKEIYAMPSHQNTIIRLCLGIRGMGERVTQPELCVLKQNEVSQNKTKALLPNKEVKDVESAKAIFITSISTHYILLILPQIIII